MSQTLTAMPALTRLAEDEAIFRDSVYEFADKEIRPLAREMDEHAKMSPELIKKLFDLGVMSIEIPESYGGAGGSFFHSVLAVESMSRVDPLVIHSLRPVMAYPSPCSTARVVMAKASLPDPASDKQKAPIRLFAIFGR